MSVAEMLLIVVGVAYLGFGIWAWIGAKPARKNSDDDAPGSIPLLQMGAAFTAFYFVVVVLLLVIGWLLTSR